MKNCPWCNLFLIMVLNALLFISCSKEELHSPPVIKIHSPKTDDNFSAFDTVMITASISDDKLVHHVVLTLKSEDHVSMLSKDIVVNASSFELNEPFVINNGDLNGRYYFEVKAYDEGDFTSAFRFVNIGGGSKKLSKVFIYTKNSSSCEIYEMKNYTLYPVATFQGDFLESALSNNDEILYCSGLKNGDLNCLDTAGNVLWTVPEHHLGSMPFFTDIHLYEDALLVGFYEGRIDAYRNSGDKDFEKALSSGHVPGKIARHQDQVIYEKMELATGKVSLVNDYYPSGLVRGETIFNYGRMEALYTLSWNEALVFSNDLGKQHILKLNTENHYLTTLLQTNGPDSLRNVVRIDADNFLMVKGKDIVRYNVVQNQYFDFVKSKAPVVMRYDASENLLWTGRSHELIVYDVASGSEVNSYQLSITIASLEIFRAY